MKILITGNKGFIGNHLWKALEPEHQLLGMDKKDGYTTADFTKFPPVVPESPIDIIVHLGANCSTQKSLDNPVDDFEDNVMGTINVIEFARTFGIPVIFTSTCKVQPGEDGARTPYGLSKYVCEEYIEEYHKCYDLQYIINRPGTIYGPGQEGSAESGWVSWFLKARQTQAQITLNGDGSHSRDILHVGDYIELLMDQITNFEDYKNQTYEVGGGSENEVNLLQMLEFIDYKNYVHGPERRGDVKRFVADNTKVSSVYGWTPQISWKEGVKRLL